MHKTQSTHVVQAGQAGSRVLCIFIAPEINEQTDDMFCTRVLCNQSPIPRLGNTQGAELDRRCPKRRRLQSQNRQHKAETPVTIILCNRLYQVGHADGTEVKHTFNGHLKWLEACGIDNFSAAQQVTFVPLAMSSL